MEILQNTFYWLHLKYKDSFISLPLSVKKKKYLPIFKSLASFNEKIVRYIWLFFIWEKPMAPHSSTLPWKIPWAEEPGRLQSIGSLRVRHGWATSLSLSLSCIGEGKGNPLQCSCLENPRDGVACWAAIYGVTQSQTRLKRLNNSIYIYEVDDTALQYSCLENHMDGGVW